MAEPTKAELQELLTEKTKRVTELESSVATLTEAHQAAADRADVATKGRMAAQSRVVELEEQVDSLGKSLRAYKGSATKLQSKVEILKCKLSPESRKIGAMKAARDAEEAAARAAAIDAAFAMGPVEIVFSDGRKEIREIAPLKCTADAFRQTPHHRELASDPTIDVVGERDEVRLAGFGLLNEAGDQVAYCELPSVIIVPRGPHMRLPLGMIRF